ncbi:hypothetical protein VTJ49DRAFT_5699 [Mycothermus thermophilus]|uniref:rRNA-processing protein EFG1 n=1 Tax=Humicola insolens TaxID=85995 RepID=A0ABR3V2K0_HUMIN
MGRKRPRPDEESSGHPAEKRQRTNKPHGKAHGKPHHKKPRKDVDLESINAIKKRARAIERLLARDDAKEDGKLPANKRIELERELAAHKQRIEDAHVKKERSKMISKYHMVRFFERKKAMRFAKQLEKRIAKTTDPKELAQYKADLHVAQVDIDYAKYFPFMEPYISLYAGVASGPKEEEETAAFAQYLRTPRPPMWKLIEGTREEGEAALERMQNRPPQRASEAETEEQEDQAEKSAEKRSDKKKKKDRKEKKKGPRQERKAKKAAKPAEQAARGDGKKKAESSYESDSEGSDAGGFFDSMIFDIPVASLMV